MNFNKLLELYENNVKIMKAFEMANTAVWTTDISSALAVKKNHEILEAEILKASEKASRHTPEAAEFVRFMRSHCGFFQKNRERMLMFLYFVPDLKGIFDVPGVKGIINSLLEYVKENASENEAVYVDAIEFKLKNN